MNDLDLTKVTLGSNVLELNARDQLKESSKKTNLKVMYDVPYTYQTDAVVHVAIEKFDAEIIHIPFFVNTETGEIDQSFRQSWSPFPPRLFTRSGAVVH